MMSDVCKDCRAPSFCRYNNICEIDETNTVVSHETGKTSHKEYRKKGFEDRLVNAMLIGTMFFSCLAFFYGAWKQPAALIGCWVVGLAATYLIEWLDNNG